MEVRLRLCMQSEGQAVYYPALTKSSLHTPMKKTGNTHTQRTLQTVALTNSLHRQRGVYAHMCRCTYRLMVLLSFLPGSRATVAPNLLICRSTEDAHIRITFLFMYLVCRKQNAEFILIHGGNVYVCIVILLYLYVVYCL